jgi:DnaJ-class molecular chaperone
MASIFRRESVLRIYHYGITVRRASTVSKPCPFQVLGVSRDSTYAHIKKTFLKIAMQNHPDVVDHQLGGLMHDRDKDKKRKESVQIFMNARQAFESIVPLDNGGCALRFVFL